MNAKERAILAKIYDGLNAISGLRPNNPADWKRKSANFDRIMNAAPRLLGAVSSLGFRDYELAHEDADDALAILRPALGSPGETP